jgi:hypothetical protein
MIKQEVLQLLKGIMIDTNGNMTLPKTYKYIPQAIRIENGNVYKSETGVVDVTPRIVKDLIEYIEREVE